MRVDSRATAGRPAFRASATSGRMSNTLPSRQGFVIHRLVLVDPRQVERHDLGILLSGARVEDDNFLLRLHLAACFELFQAIETDRRLGANADTFFADDSSHPFDNALFFAGDGTAAAFVNGIEHHEIADGGWHAQAARRRVSVWEQLGEALARLVSAYDGRAAIALATDETWQLVAPEPAELAQLGEGFPHTDQPG